MILKPNTGETQDDFIKRFMADEGMIAEFPDQDQRAAVCAKAWGEVANESKDSDAVVFQANEARIDGNALMLCPFGAHANSGGMQNVTREACQALANSFNGIWNKLVRGGAPIYIGHPDHPAFQSRDRDMRALGWIKSLEVRDDGLWANAKFNSRGKEIVNEEELIYPSVNWEVRRRDGAPTRLQSVGLTNCPNIQGVPPIGQVNEKIIMNKELLKLLGLPDTATEADVIKAANEIKTTLATALANATAAGESVKTLTGDKTTLEANISALTTEKATLTGQVTTLTAEKAAAEKAKAEAAAAQATAETTLANERKARAQEKVATLIVAGKITKAQEDAVTVELANDFNAAAAKYDAVKPALHTQSAIGNLGNRSSHVVMNNDAFDKLVNERMQLPRFAGQEPARKYALAAAEVTKEHPELFIAVVK